MQLGAARRRRVALVDVPVVLRAPANEVIVRLLNYLACKVRGHRWSAWGAHGTNLGQNYRRCRRPGCYRFQWRDPEGDWKEVPK